MNRIPQLWLAALLVLPAFNLMAAVDADAEIVVGANACLVLTSANSASTLQVERPVLVAEATAEPVSSVWSNPLSDYYTSQGLGTAGQGFIDSTGARITSAFDSRDPGELLGVARQMQGFIAAINRGRNRWGNPVLTDAQADAMIAGARSILGALPDFLESGLLDVRSDRRDRSYYLKLPADYAATKGTKPLIIAYHGSFGSHRSWIGDESYYDFVDVVGDGAVMVIPDALPLGEGRPNWNFEYDFKFFQDLVKDMDDLGIKYDKNKLFVVGHSSGAGMAQEIGCRFGDIVRAIAASSGSLISNQCVGSIGVIQTQGDVDTAVPPTIGAIAHNFWALYNGWDIKMSTPAEVAPCVDHSLLPIGSTDFPVQFCSHTGGHPWTDFNSEAYWGFFSGLPVVAPSTDEPPGGGNEVVLAEADTTVSFTLNFPDTMGPVVAGAITLYPESHCVEKFAAPTVFLNVNWNPGAVAPGSQVVYDNIPITYFSFGTDFNLNITYKMLISVYNEGGSQPIPTPGIDHLALVPVFISDTTTPIIFPEAIDMAAAVPFTGCN